VNKSYPDGIELDAEEQEYEDAFDEFVPAPESEREALIAAAKAGRRPLSVRIESADIAALKRLAAREGMPYQTLLGSIVHKYVTGNLVDVNEARKVLARP
jgi:predicted DNA binding CopG/RHH family protein